MAFKTQGHSFKLVEAICFIEVVEAFGAEEFVFMLCASTLALSHY
jgi:hypothetical protein